MRERVVALAWAWLLQNAGVLCQAFHVRLNPGIDTTYADDILRRAEVTWSNARSAQDRYRAYTDAVHDTYPTLKQVFADPDIDVMMRSPAYWNLLSIGALQPQHGFISDPDMAMNVGRTFRAQNQALNTEIDNQVKALDRTRSEFQELKKLTSRPGLPVVYDTNMLNHWRQPSDVVWQEIFKDRGRVVSTVRLVVPLRVINELDKQKYGDGELAKRATTAIRYLERVLNGGAPGEPVQLRKGVTLEVWLDTDRGGPADLAILRCASDLASLHPSAGVCVLTNDFGMRLSASQMGLPVLELPADHRKPSSVDAGCP